MADILFKTKKKGGGRDTVRHFPHVVRVSRRPSIMFIVSLFDTRYNGENGCYEIDSHEEALCPYCGATLKYRNSRLRQLLDALGEKTVYRLRRLLCEGCRKLHTEIPDTIQPYKHYDTKTIQDVLDGGGQTCAADDSTIRRWRSDFEGGRRDIECRLASIRAVDEDAHAPLLGGGLLARIVEGEPCWLAFVMKLLICRGHRLCTRFAFCPDADSAKVAIDGDGAGKAGVAYDKTEEDTG